MQRLLPLCLLLWATAATAYAQLGFGSPNTVNAAPNSVNYCEDDPAGFFEVNWRSNGAVARGDIEVLLPTGARFIGGSNEDVNATPVGFSSGVQVRGDTLRFILRNLVDGDNGTIRYKLRYDCRLDTVLAEPYQMRVRAISGDDVFEVRTEAINNTASKPLVQPEVNANTAIVDAEPGDAFTREFAVAQTGQLSQAFAFTLCVNYGDGLTPSNQTLEGEPVTFPNANGGCIRVDSAGFPGLPWPFAQDDRWVFREDVSLDQCSGLGTTVRTNFGCGPAPCQEEARMSLPVTLADNAPTITRGDHSRFLDTTTCMADGIVVEAAFEVTGKAYDTRLRIQSRGGNTYIEPGSVEVDYGTGSYSAYTGTLTPAGANDGGCDAVNVREYFLDALAAPLDAAGGALTVRVRFRALWCCEANASSGFDTQGLYGYFVELEAFDKCGARQRDNVQRAGSSVGASGSSEVPASIAEGDTLEWRYRFNLFNLATELRPNTDLCVEFAFPAGVTPVPGVEALYESKGGDALQRAPAIALGGGRYRACFTGRQFYSAGAVLSLPATYACTATQAGTDAVSSATVSLSLGAAACPAAGECDLVLFVAEGTTRLGDACVAPACDGVRHLGAEVARTSFGAPDNDNDGCGDAGGVVDPTVVRTDRAMEGDRLVVVTEALVTLASPTDAFDYLTVDLDWDLEHTLLTGTEVEVVDAGTGAIYTCATVAVTAIDANRARASLAAPELAGCGTVPAGFRFADGDTVRLRVPYEVTGNPGCDMVDATVTPDWYADRSANAGADRLQCNLPIPAGYEQVGYGFLLQTWNDNEFGCAGNWYEFRASFCVGGGINGSYTWPGEVRDYGQPAAFGMEVPPGMSYDSIAIQYLNRTRFPGQSGGGRYDMTDFASVQGDFVVVDWTAFTADCEDPDMMPGEGYRFVTRAYFEGSCRSERIRPRGYLTPRFDYPDGSSYADRAEPLDFRYTRDIRVRVPDLDLSSSTADIAPFDERARWSFSIRETTGEVAPNAYVAFASPSGEIAPTELTLNGALVEPTGGYYRLGDLGASSVNELTVAANYTSCSADSLRVLVGWECGGYPASAAEIVAGGTLCAPEELTLRMFPQEPGVQLAIIEQPAERTEACSDQRYELELLNTTNAVIYEPQLELFVPYNGGVEIVPTTGRAAYPSPRNPTDGDFGVALGEPVATITTTVGTKYIWDLDASFAAFDHTADLGWPGQNAADPDAKRISVAFEARTECGFIIGDYLNFRIVGRSYCGERAASVLRNGRQIQFTGVTTPYTATLELEQPDTVEACTPAGGPSLSGQVAFFDDTDGEDFLLLALPPALRYDGLTVEDGVFDLAGAVVTEIPTDAGDLTFDEVRIPVVAGVDGFRNIPFAIDTRVDPAGLLCDDPSVIRLRSVRGVEYECRGAPCEGLIETGTIPTDNEGFLLATDTFSVAGVNLRLSCDLDSLELESLEVVNEATDEITADLEVRVYRDLDGNRRRSRGDELVVSYPLTGGVPGGATRSFSAAYAPIDGAVDPDALLVEVQGCTCEAPEVNTINFSEEPRCAAIGDYVFVDGDGDGLQGAADVPLPGVAVRLHDAATGTEVATATTDADGLYAFDGQPAGRYYVVFDPSTSELGGDFAFTVQGGAFGAPDDSDAAVGGRSPAFDFDPQGGSLDHVDAGVIPRGAVAAVRYAESFAEAADGIVTAVIVTGVRNTGRVDLTGFSLVDPLADDFGASLVDFAVESGTPAAPPLAVGYDGAADLELLESTATYVLAAGEEFAVRTTVRFDPRVATFPILTQATVRARPAVGGQAVSGEDVVVADLSDSGTDFAGTNPGEPGDTGTADDPLEITCRDAAAEILGGDQTSCVGTLVPLGAASALGDEAAFTWVRPGSDEVLAEGPELAAAAGSTAALRVSAGGCLYGTTAEAEIAGEPIPTLLTPNDDGNNDLFRIPCLEAFPGSGIAIYNRWGDAVYQVGDYRGDWGGTFNDRDLPEGTYFYILHVASPEPQTVNGYIYLKR